MNNEVLMPVDSLSYSALTQLLRNPLIFKMKHILGVYDGKMSVSGMIGKAVHESLKVYHGGHPDIPAPANKIEAQALARELGLKYLDGFSDAYIEYGKTGSREEMLKGYAQTMEFFFAEEPEYHEILSCEEKMTATLKTLEGEELPLPASGVPDLVHKRKDEAVDIIDYKVVRSFTDYETEDYIKIIQGMFMFHLVLAVLGIRAERMLFREIKRTKNKDGSPQIRDWAIPLDHEPYRIIFYNLYKDVVKYLKNDPVFLPNLSDPFDGEHAGLIYAEGLINSDMSDVEVMHKVRDVAFTTRKFVGSRLDRAENETLLPEERVKVRLSEFGIPVEPEETRRGPSIVQYRFKVSAGIRMSSIKKHKDDIKNALRAHGDIRIIAPIPGTDLVGIEVETEKRVERKLKKSDLKPETLSLPIGVDVNNELTSVSLEDMPHLLIAGATGSGKSELLHTFIKALTKQMKPSDMKMLLIDPKRVELSHFRNSKHLLGKVYYDQRESELALDSMVCEMEKRYRKLERAGARDIREYNKLFKKKLPYYVVVVDEFGDFMINSKIEEQKSKKKNYHTKGRDWLEMELSARGLVPPIRTMTKSVAVEMLEQDDERRRGPDVDVELSLVRLAQMARAVGIHLVITTQRPSVDIITGLIKANFPTRIALTTASATDSKVILGQEGAEKLTGKGDMLFAYHGGGGIKRLQGIKT